MSAIKDFFSDAEKEAIRVAIEAAEKRTSGEIRVHIENSCDSDPVNCAEKWFGKLKMHQTQLRSGVLFYLAVKTHAFAIYGDKGINEKVPAGFWTKISEHMGAAFRAHEFARGLMEGIEMAGEQLALHFPYESDKNELTDDISYQ
ncbi:MAG TPA: TPM domain-containing protein [Bacteroidia bacterium]|nr:TPM domain-containing protein [Bacteroidia bacterium]